MAQPARLMGFEPLVLQVRDADPLPVIDHLGLFRYFGIQMMCTAGIENEHATLSNAVHDAFHIAVGLSQQIEASQFRAERTLEQLGGR